MTTGPAMGSMARAGGFSLAPRDWRDGAIKLPVASSDLRGPAATDVHHNFVQRWNEASDRDLADGLWPDALGQGELPFPESLSPAAGERARVREPVPT